VVVVLLLVGGWRLLFSNSTGERLDSTFELQTQWREESATKSAAGTQQIRGRGEPNWGSDHRNTGEGVAIVPSTGVIRSKSSERMGWFESSPLVAAAVSASLPALTLGFVSAQQQDEDEDEMVRQAAGASVWA